jgi:GxxExxY protein
MTARWPYRSDTKDYTSQRAMYSTLVENSLVVEIKAVDKLLPVHSAQLMTYMRLQEASCGLLPNFNVQLLPHGIKRMLL